MPDTSLVSERIEGIEAEMKRIGMWRNEPLPPHAYEFHRAFAMDTMAFSQWLQFVFIPKVRQIIQTNGAFPARSQVGAQAIREFDGDNNAATLVSMLASFDALIGDR